MDPTLMPVQNILQSAGVVPKDYIQPKDDSHLCDGPPPLMNEPTIDLSLLRSSTPEELAKLRFALSSWGCAQVVNHGMSTTYLEEVREISKQFFNQPLEEKEKYSLEGKNLEGYGNTNTVQQGIFNWNDRLHLQVYPVDKRQLQFWPENPKNFRTTLHEYSEKNRMMHGTLLKAMALSLNLKEDAFHGFWGDNEDEDMIHARFNFYPKCPISDQVVGLKPHGDGTLISIILQDKEVEGLQILKDNRWYRVPIIPGALTIVVGDQMEIASNGIFKSPTHKVLINPQYDRISLVMFFVPSSKKEIGPINELINEDRPQLYERLTDYGQVYKHSIPDGGRHIDAVKIRIRY